METPPRHYLALAFLPVVLAVVTLIALYFYQQGAEERRDRWQKPEAILDSIGVSPGMRVAEWHPADTYFLERLARRVGSEGLVYAVQPTARVVKAIERSLPGVAVVPELPSALDALLLLQVSTAEQDMGPVAKELQEAGQRLPSGARLGWIGIRSERLDNVIGPEELTQAAAGQNLRLIREEDFLDRQFLLVLEKN